jgi:hypothetical protein
VTTARVSRRARRRLLGAAAIFCVFLLASCRAILGTDGYKGSVEVLCGLLARCYGEDDGTCQEAIGNDLTYAETTDRERWLQAFSDRACFQRCAAARRCLNTRPVCSLGLELCSKREDCCGFVEGEKDCNSANNLCCTRRGSRCSVPEDCCPGAGDCLGGVCGGVPCGLAGSACSIGAQCCTGVCRDGACGEDICFEDGFECDADADCCKQFCDPGTRKCGKPECSVETCSEDVPCCGELVCRNGICSDPLCYSDGVDCSLDSQCCGKRCDPKLFTCLSCEEGAAMCDMAGECCSGVCEGGVCVDCLPNGEACGAAGKKCCSTLCQAPDPAFPMELVCVPQCGNVGCAHDTCTPGEPLRASCSACAKQVCAEDPYCCCEGWDSLCVSEAAAICSNSCE